MSWARKIRPHLVIYGFTMPNIAMIISEKQKIPMIGFVLQPSVIPSEHTVAVEAINTHYFGCFDRLEVWI